MSNVKTWSYYSYYYPAMRPGSS